MKYYIPMCMLLIACSKPIDIKDQISGNGYFRLTGQPSEITYISFDDDAIQTIHIVIAGERHAGTYAVINDQLFWRKVVSEQYVGTDMKIGNVVCITDRSLWLDENGITSKFNRL